MSADIGRHWYVAMGDGPRPERCAECYQPAGHPVHRAVSAADRQAYEADRAALRRESLTWVHA
jgi:hypothetical protein